MIDQNQNVDINESIIKSLSHYLYELKRYRFAKMNGDTVMGLPRHSKAEEYEEIHFTEIVNQMRNDQDFSPAKYLAKITKMCREKQLSEDMTIGILARGLRIFPSFLREIDVEEQLKKILEEREISHFVIRDPGMDIIQHTDIMVRINNGCYRIWLFDNSPRGIKNTRDRLQGNRGKLPEGIHILCPMNPLSGKHIYTEINGWRFYSTAYVENIVTYMETLPFRKIPIYEEFIFSMDLTKDEIQAFLKYR